MKGNDPVNRLVGKATLTSGLLLRRSGKLRSLVKDITQSAAWRREAWKEEALDDLPSEDGREPLSVRRTLELFQKATAGDIRYRAERVSDFPSA